MISSLTRGFLVAASLCSALASGALAQQPSPSHLALARDMLVKSGMSRTFDAVPASIAGHLRGQIVGVTRPEIGKDFDEVAKSMETVVAPRRQEIMALAAAVVVKQFTEADLKEIVAFFDSPVGKKYIEGQPKLLDGVVDAMTTWGQALENDVIGHIRVEMRKRGHDM